MNRNQRTGEVLRLLPALRRISRPRSLEAIPRQGLSTAQIQVIAHLAQNGSVGMGDLATGIGTSFSALTELVDRLEERGIVERVRSVRDRRQIMVQLTESWRPIADSVLRERMQVVDQVLNALSESEQDAFITGLKLLVTAMSERGAAPALNPQPDAAEAPASP
ncbi:MAG: MarR family transcriptional regulator [Chloroflexi bacterium]|nr:MarR family transcriptional regulator [Chloroflexota bacterium]